MSFLPPLRKSDDCLLGFACLSNLVKLGVLFCVTLRSETTSSITLYNIHSFSFLLLGEEAIYARLD